MVIEDEFDEYGSDYDEEDSSGGASNPQWRTLSPKERKLLMKNVFSNPDWYDDSQGSPVFEGGSANPMFEEISDKAGAPVKETLLPISIVPFDPVKFISLPEPGGVSTVALPVLKSNSDFSVAATLKSINSGGVCLF